MRRSTFLKHLATAALAPATDTVLAFPADTTAKPGTVTAGWITDVHHGYCPDATSRLEAFIDAAIERKPDFILQGGDFCHPRPDAQPFLDVWNRFPGEKYHVLGNHDMDFGTKRDIMDRWGMPQRHYAFDKGGFHFVVMDCNHILADGRYLDYVKGNFYIDAEKRDLVDPAQLEWLKADLQAADKPCIIVSHQSFDEVWTGKTVPNRLAVRNIIDTVNAGRPTPRVVACICGHHHLDHHMVIRGVHYIHINSAAYYYVGDGFGSDGARATYADPLYTFITFDPRGSIRLEAKKSRFLSPTPADKGFPQADRLSACISTRRLPFEHWH